MREVVVAMACTLAAGWSSAQGQAVTESTRIDFEPTGVVASGFPPGAKIAWYSFAQKPATFFEYEIPKQEASRGADGLGRARLEIEGGPPPRSIWVAVDLQNGRSAVATPPGYPLRRLAVDAEPFAGEKGGASDRLVYRGHFLCIFVSRPGSGGGAWSATVWDGAREDLDGPANNSITVSIGALAPIDGGSAAPPAFRPSDVVTLIDPDRMAVAVLSPGAKPLGETDAEVGQ